MITDSLDAMRVHVQRYEGSKIPSLTQLVVLIFTNSFNKLASFRAPASGVINFGLAILGAGFLILKDDQGLPEQNSARKLVLVSLLMMVLPFFFQQLVWDKYFQTFVWGSTILIGLGLGKVIDQIFYFSLSKFPQNQVN
jgi:hypothetical protein